MIGAGRFRRQQKKNQIDGLRIERFEIDAALQPREQAAVRIETQLRRYKRRRKDNQARRGG